MAVATPAVKYRPVIGTPAATRGGKSRRMQHGILGAGYLLVVGVYAYVAQSGTLKSSSLKAADIHYMTGGKNGECPLFEIS